MQATFIQPMVYTQAFSLKHSLVPRLSHSNTYTLYSGSLTQTLPRTQALSLKHSLVPRLSHSNTYTLYSGFLTKHLYLYILV